MYLRQSTTATVKLGPFVAPSDGLTPYTAGGFAVKLAKAGGALAARNDATAIAHDADGFYAVELDATDTGTIGRLRVEVPGAAALYLPAWMDFEVLSAAVYDVMFGTTAPSTYSGGPVASVTAPVTVGTNDDKTGYSLAAATAQAPSVRGFGSGRQFKPGDAHGVLFCCTDATGALADADSPPTAAAYRNEAADVAVSVTVAHVATGVYRATCAIPDGYAAGDRFSVVGHAAIGGIAAGAVLDQSRLVGWPASGVITLGS